MKYIFLATVLFSGQLSQAQWELNFQTPHQQIVAVFSSPDDHVAWFITNMDSLFQTHDGGQHWQKKSQGVPAFYPSGLFVVNEDTAFKSSSNSLYRTTDGGSHWTNVFSGSFPLPPLVWMKDPMNGVMAYGGLLYKTIDCGASWTIAGIEQPPHLVTTNPGKGNLWGKGDTLWVAQENSGVAVSPDFGLSWNLPSNTGIFFSGWGCISFSDSQLGIAITQNLPFVYVTTDGGDHWTESVNTLGANQDVLGWDDQLWFIPNPADHFYVAYSEDNGQHWVSQLTDNDGFGVLEKSRNGSTIWTGTEKGKVYRYYEQAPVSLVNRRLIQKPTVSPNPFSDHLDVRLQQPQASYKLCNTHGLVLLKGILKDEQNSIPVQFLPSGIYFFMIDDGRDLSVLKIIK